MKKTILVLLALLLALTMTVLLVACNDNPGPVDPTDQDPCKNGHVEDDGAITVQPTCQTEGTRTYRCKVCGEVVKTETVDKTDHVWDNGTPTQDPGCGTVGKMTFHCTQEGCNETKTEDIPATGVHTKGTWVPEVPATCKAEGSHDYYQCTNCSAKLDDDGNEYDAADLVIPKAAHTWDNGVVTPATCEEEGHITYTCEVCSTTSTQTIPANGHTYGELIPQQDATCEHTGVEAHYMCSVCDKLFDEAREPVEEADLEIGLAKHTLDEVTGKPATCTEDGFETYYKCNVCNKLFADDKAETPIEQPKTLTATGHKPIPYGDKAATCTEAGYANGKICSECGTVIVQPKRVAPLGHDYKLQGWKWGSSNLTATATFECTHENCLEPTVQVTGDSTVESTLDTDTFTVKVKGPDGRDYTQTTTYDHNHPHVYEFVEWRWTGDDESGYTATAVFDCSKCHKVPQEVPGDVATQVQTAVSCTTDGVTVYTATASYNGVEATPESKTVTVPALGHKIDPDKFHKGTEVTCLEDGTKDYYECANGCHSKLDADGNVIDDLTIKAVGHHTYNGYKTNATQHWQECTVCGQSTTKTNHAKDYSPIDGTSQHHESCDICGYEANVNCSSASGDYSGKCRYCGVYHGDEIIIHFHHTDDWGSDLRLHAWFGSTNITGDWPGSTGGNINALPEEWASEGEGWYVITLHVRSGLLGNTLYVIVNDGKGDSPTKTGDIKVDAKEIYIPGIVGGDKAYLDKDEALKKEIDAPDSSVYFLAGTFNGENKWGDGTTGDWSNVFSEKNSWKLTVTLVKGDQFRILKNDAKYDKNHGYDQRDVTKASTVTGNIDLLFSRGSVMDDNNFVVNYGCTVEITFNPNGDGKVHVYVTDAPDLPTESVTPKYIVVGVFGNEDDWHTDSTKRPMVLNADGSYTITLNLLEGDQFQIIEYSSSGAWTSIWDGYKLSSITTTWADGVEHVSNLFANSGNNIVSNHVITCEVTYKSGKISVHVTSLTKGTGIKVWYISGTMNGWGIVEAWKFTDNGNGTFTLSNVTIAANATFKVRSGSDYYGYDKNIKINGKAASYFSEDKSNGDRNIKCSTKITVDLTWNPSTVTLTVNLHTHTHNYTVTWEWNADHTQATATFTCNASGCTEPNVTKTATGEAIKENITLDATCTTAGSKTYTATVTGPDGKTTYTDTTDAIEIPATGHTYVVGDDAWTWQLDGETYTATVTLTCSKCAEGVEGHTTVIEDVKVSGPVEVGATCTTDGSKTYTATATVPTNDGNTYPEGPLTATKQDVIPAKQHSYVVDTTKGDDGNGLVWKDDHTSATLYLVCENDETHKLTYTFDSSTTNGGDCTSASTTTYTVTVTQEAVQAKVTAEPEGGSVKLEETLTLTFTDTTADISGHNWTLQSVEWGRESNPTQFTVVIKCSNKIHDGIDCNSTLTLTFEGETEFHEPTCTEAGYTLYTLQEKAEDVRKAAEEVAKTQGVTLCSEDTYPAVNKDVNDQCEQRVEGAAAKGHSYQAVWNWQEGYTYSAETKPTVTVTLTCGNGCGEETRVVTVSVGENLVVVEDDGRKDATCTEEGSVSFTATLTYDGLADGVKSVTNQKSYTITQLGHELVEGDFQDLGEGQHGQKCSRCEQYVNPQSHDELVWVTVVAEQRHYKECSTCHYKEDEDACQIEEGNLTSEKCSVCEHQYADEITIYLHQNSTTTWAAENIYLWAYVENGTKSLYDEYPGRLGLFTACQDSSMSGWVEAKITVARGHLNKDLYVVANLGENAAQTGNIQITAKTMYISKNLNFNKGYTSKTLATNAEKDPAPTTTRNGYYFLTGCFNGTNAESGFTPTTTDWARVFRPEKDYTIEAYFNKDDTFRVKENYFAGQYGWSDTQYGYSNMKVIGGADGIDTTTIFGAYKEDNNIQVLKACRVRITLSTSAASGQKIQIYVIALGTASHTHNLGELVPETQGTCTDVGVLAHYRCSCGLYYNLERRVVDLATLQTSKDLDNHNWQLVNEGKGKDPTCTEAGYNAYYECEYCHKFATNSNPSAEEIFQTEAEVQQAKGVAIEATGHTFELAKQETYVWSELTATSAKLTVNYTCHCGVTHSVEFEITSPLTKSDANCEDDKKVYFTHQADAQAVKEAAKEIQDKDTFVGFGLQTSEDFTIEDTHLGHTYEYTSLEWSDKEGYTKATLTLTCKNDGCEGDGHIITVELLAENQTTGESVNCGDKTTVTMVLDPKSTSNLELIKASVGKNHLDESTLDNKTISQQLSETTLGHKWKLAENPYKWTEDETKATATVEVTLECSVCGKSVTATFTNTGRSTEEATCLKAEQITFTLTKAAGEVQAAVSVGQHGEVEVYKEDIFAEAAINNATYTIDGAAELGHDFDGSAVYVDNKDGATHSKQCSRCDVVSQTKTSHDITYDVDVAGQTHTEKCDTCHYKAESAVACTPQIVLTTANGSETEKCSVCEQDYADKITVHFHINQDWGVDWGTNLYWYACYGSKSAVTKLTAAYPGNDTKETVSTSGSRWVVVEFTVSRQHLGKDLIIIFSDSNFQTHNVEIEDNEIWISKDGFWATAETDVTSHESSTTLPTTSDYILVGTIGDEDFWYKQSTSAYNAFLKSNSYTLTLNFVAGNEFKVKQNVSSDSTTWYGYDAIKSMTYEDTTTPVDLNQLITKITEGDGANNIHINKDCTLEITYDHSVGILIHVVKATGLSSITPIYYLRGTFGTNNWGTTVCLSKGKTGDDNNDSYTVKYKFSMGEEFKVGDFTYDKDTGCKGAIAKISSVSGTVASYISFTNRNYKSNIKVSKACTVVITYYPGGGDWTDGDSNGGDYKTGWVDIVVVA